MREDFGPRRPCVLRIQKPETGAKVCRDSPKDSRDLHCLRADFEIQGGDPSDRDQQSGTEWQYIDGDFLSHHPPLQKTSDLLVIHLPPEYAALLRSRSLSRNLHCCTRIAASTTNHGGIPQDSWLSLLIGLLL